MLVSFANLVRYDPRIKSFYPSKDELFIFRDQLRSDVGLSPLHYLVVSLDDHPEWIDKIKLYKKKDTLKLTKSGYSPLDYACIEGSEKAIIELVKIGSTIDQRNSYIAKNQKPHSLLHLTLGRPNLVKLLISLGVNKYSTNSDGDTPLLTYLKNKMTNKSLDYLLEVYYFLEDKDNLGRTAIMYAHTDEQFIKLKSADMFYRDSNNISVLMHALKNCISTNILKNIYSPNHHYCNCEQWIAKARDIYGNTTLFYALNDDAIAWLCYYVNINTKNNNGETALVDAIKSGELQKAKCLLSLGADPLIADKKIKMLFVILKRKAMECYSKLLLISMILA